ncbi:MAG TPA: family 16 glycoside hydrolase, partial [Vicinamibacteria bacterium]|nr:family 16 glycoside hydrolase [Vicinamibacteria bacterium]
MSREAVARALVRLAVLMAVTATVLPAAEVKGAGEWRPLFDGKTTAGWRGYKTQDVPAGWAVVDGVLVKEGKSTDLVTKDQY